MGVVLVAGCAVLAGFALIVLLGRAVPGRTFRAGREAEVEHAWLAAMGPEAFGRLLGLLFSELDFEVEHVHTESNVVDLFVSNPKPITGGRVYVRGVYAPPGGSVAETEVRAAIDTARAGRVSKAVVATPGNFSVEARAAAVGGPVDLLDGAELLRLTQQHLPQVAVTRRIDT